MIELLKICDLENCVAIIPSICVGNVGQLTCDLLIFGLNLKKLGYVWHSHVLTFSGADPYADSSDFSTAFELFYSESLKLIVFQIRSALKRNVKGLVDELCDWLKNIHVKQVIVLAGISAHSRGDHQLVGEPLRYVFCPITKKIEKTNATGRNWIELEGRKGVFDLEKYNLPGSIPGAGIASTWFNKCVKDEIPCCILFEFCSDGNNTPDALKLAEYLDEWLQLKEKQKITCWKVPPSWGLLFGCLAPTEIFN